MNSGYLVQFFKDIVFKQLSAVETVKSKSTQHEYNGIAALKPVLGNSIEKKRIAARFMYMCDDTDDAVSDDGMLTWYNSRVDKNRSTEFRLYYTKNIASEQATVGDLLLICLKRDGTALCIMAQQGSTIAAQLLWLFGIREESEQFQLYHEIAGDTTRVGFAANLILEQIGVQAEPEYLDYCDEMVERFAGAFPSTVAFSSFARKTLTRTYVGASADDILMDWLEREEKLFRWFEHYLLKDRLMTGFDGSVDEFITLSLSVQNRRKSRIGHALENHLSELFKMKGVKFTSTPITKNGSRPDFIFPGIIQYNNAAFETSKLTMLGAKSTCKDRWRQVLAEAERIDEKHLLTLEPAISTNQTKEMMSSHLRLIVPKILHATYKPIQQEWLMDLDEFIGLVLKRQ